MKPNNIQTKLANPIYVLLTLLVLLAKLLSCSPEEKSAKIYWTDLRSNNSIQRASLDGTHIEDLVTGLGDAEFICLYMSR